MIYDENEATYLLGLRYKNGHLQDVIKPSQSNGGRRGGDCYKGIYQRNAAAQVGGGGSSSGQRLADQYGMPVSIDFGGLWSLVDVQETDCGDGLPTNSPLFGSDPNEIDWLRPYGSGGTGTTGGGPKPDPDEPIPVYQPSDPSVPDGLSSANAFFWELERGPAVRVNLSAEEKDVIREYPELILGLWDNFVHNRLFDGSNAFLMSAVDQQQYPRFTELVKDLPSFVEQHERVKNALMKHTNLPWSKIKILLRFGSGPVLSIYDINRANLYGRTIHPGFPESRIEIQAKFVRGLDSANLTGTKEATAFLLTVTLLHEITHYGAVDGGRNETAIDEFGFDFEREVMGTSVTKDNAGKLLIEFEKKN